MPIKSPWRTRIAKIERQRKSDKPPGLIWLSPDLTESEFEMAKEMIARGETPPERFLFFRPGAERRI